MNWDLFGIRLMSLPSDGSTLKLITSLLDLRTLASQLCEVLQSNILQNKAGGKRNRVNRPPSSNLAVTPTIE
jgi:hypothetical protein